MDVRMAGRVRDVAFMMGFPCRAPLFLALAAFFSQDSPPPRLDLAARYASILERGHESRRDLAARALLSLGRAGHDALKRIFHARPDLAKSLPPPEDLPPPASLVRIPPPPDEEKRARDLIAAPDWGPEADASIRRLGTAAELFLWEALDSRVDLTASRAARLLRELYAPPDAAPPGRPSDALRAELDRRRDFDVGERKLSQFLAGESFSWILMTARDPRIEMKLRGVTLRDFLRQAVPSLAAVPAGDLLIFIPPDRVAMSDPGDAVWASSDLVPRLEAALVALAAGDGAAMDALTGIGACHALKRAARSGGPAFATRADAMVKLLEQRVFFIGAADDDASARITLEPAGKTMQETLVAFEKAAGRGVTAGPRANLSDPPPAFRFRAVPAGFAARALEFRVNLIP